MFSRFAILIPFACAAFAAFGAPLSAETLERAVVNAILDSDARKAARAGIMARVNDLGETRAGFGATVQAHAAIRMEVSTDSGGAGETDDPLAAREAGVTLSLPLYDGGRTAALVRRDAARVDEEIIRLIDETETLALNAVQAYIDLARHDRILALTRANIATHERIRARVRALIDGGRLAASEGLRVDDRLLLARQVQLDAERARADALVRFRLNVGHAPAGAVAMPRMIAAPPSAEALVRSALENSATLAMVDSQIAQLEHQRAADAAEAAPKLDLDAGLFASADTGGVRGHESGAYVGLEMRWTLYRGGARKYREAANRDRIQRSHYERADRARQIVDVAERSWNAYRAALAERALIRRQIATSQDLVKVYLDEFTAGKRPLYDVLEAERALFNHRVQDVNAHAALHFSLYKMLAVQTRLADHFGMAHAGRPLDPTFEARAVRAPRGGFDITAPALDR